MVDCEVEEDSNGYKSLELILEAPGIEPFTLRRSPAETYFYNYHDYKEVKRKTAEELWKWRNRRNLSFDYAYAITAHKSQGGEYDTVFIYEEKAPDRKVGSDWIAPDPTEHVRWLYTAVTRAKESATIAAA